MESRNQLYFKLIVIKTTIEATVRIRFKINKKPKQGLLFTIPLNQTLKPKIINNKKNTYKKANTRKHSLQTVKNWKDRLKNLCKQI